VTTAPEDFTPEAATSMPTDADSVSPEAALELPVVDVPERRPTPTLDGRWVRARTVYEVRTRTQVDGEVETVLYRREGAALGHAARLRAQGYPVAVSVGTITWQRRPR